MPFIKNIEPLVSSEIKNCIFLMLNNIVDLPVHVSLLYFNRYYATTVNHVYKDVEGDIILKKINQKKTPVIFFKLVNNPEWNNEDIKHLYKRALPLKDTYKQEYTCLNPIAHTLSLLNQFIDTDHYYYCENVFEMLERLEKNKKKIKTYHLHCENYLSGNSMELNSYTRKETIEKITRLMGVKSC